MSDDKNTGATQPTASNAGERATADTLSFICTNGCGYCGVKLRDFVTHATQAQDSDTWVTVASEPEIVSTCCGHPVEVWDERKQDVVAEVRAALASKPVAPPAREVQDSVPADILKYAKGMQKQGYSGPLMWASKIIDWVVEQGAARARGEGGGAI